MRRPPGAAGGRPGESARTAPGPRARLLGLAAVAVVLAACGSGGDRGEDGPTERTLARDSRPAWCRALPRPAYDSLELAFTSEDGWYRVYRIRPGVHALYEPHQFQEVISYLLQGDERALLVDSGMGISPIRPVVERITDLPVTVANTHTHPDHVGGNHAFDQVLAYDTAFGRRHARRGFTRERMRDQVAPDALCRPLPRGTARDDYRIRHWEVTGTLDDGSVIELGGRTIEVLHVPGHTPDGLAFLDRADGLLLAGDNLYRGPIYLFSDETDLDAYARSVARLAALTPALNAVLPGHNTPVVPPEMLGRVSDAVEDVRSGRVVGRLADGRVEYAFEGFRLLLPGRDGRAP